MRTLTTAQRARHALHMRFLAFPARWPQDDGTASEKVTTTHPSSPHRNQPTNPPQLFFPRSQHAVVAAPR
jgi:hypothetical protein